MGRTTKEIGCRLLREVEEAVMKYNSFAWDRSLPQISNPYELMKAMDFWKKFPTELMKKYDKIVNRQFSPNAIQAKKLKVSKAPHAKYETAYEFD